MSQSAAHSYKQSDFILVTGANGFIAQHIVDQLLARPTGPRVRATVRSEGTAKQITSFYPDLCAKGRLEVVVIPDIAKPGAFDDAVKSITHIAHVASPVIADAADVANDLLKPAVQGTVGVLQAALASPTVQAVVITSSIGAVFDPKFGWRPGYTYTADDFNPITFEEAASPGFDINSYPEPWHPYIMYCASKSIAERAAWDFHKTNSPHFSLMTILPTCTGGPNILPLTRGVDSLSLSQRLFWKAATDASLPKLDWPGRVDVRDVAKAHVNALVTPEAAGKRWITSSAMASYSDIADIVRRHFPSLTPSAEVQKVDYYTVDGSPAISVLGLESYITLERTVVDTIQQGLSVMAA